jgi:hypothetical protein
MEAREKENTLMDEDDYKIKDDFEVCWGTAIFPFGPLCQLSFNKRNEENKLRQLKGNGDSSKGGFDKKQGRKHITILAFH